MSRWLAPIGCACFADLRMDRRGNPAFSWLFGAAVCIMSAVAGCYVGYYHETEHWTAADTALGEEHTVPYDANETRQLMQDTLRGDGILFEVQPDDSILTLWRNADQHTATSWFPLVTGTQPRYRYEIQFIPQGSKSTRIIVNVRTEGIPDEELASYKASNRFELFKELDELAAKEPPPSTTPSSGGVNFTLLPNENLQALARRVTGNEANWQQIASDNGLKSPSDVTPFENIWVRNSLLPKTAPSSAGD
jgi:hypothetical protein